MKKKFKVQSSFYHFSFYGCMLLYISNLTTVNWPKNMKSLISSFLPLLLSLQSLTGKKDDRSSSRRKREKMNYDHLLLLHYSLDNKLQRRKPILLSLFIIVRIIIITQGEEETVIHNNHTHILAKVILYPHTSFTRCAPAAVRVRHETRRLSTTVNSDQSCFVEYNNP